VKKQRPDKITNPFDFGSAAAEQIYHAVAALDEVVGQMENKWGADRLPRLVSAETAAKFGSAKARLDAAISVDDPDEVTKRAAVMQRAWKALDAEATKMGAAPISVDAHVWRDDSDQPHAFCRTNAEALAYAKENAGTITWTLEEIVRVAAMFEDGKMKLLTQVKQAFPGARVKRVEDKLDDDLAF
jgi:hypothetical protein